ncbi:hypothetical protein PMPD1_1746 [Paramixta manurensis]|uniref:SGNH hydrolase-type esterase domain-containing protein n=1 Tax=Paramixta manurensis TaxID=2740817 RepID=A0A6M8U7J8_9GAMM|nr:hypothetical protein PMPD1_1746 [Erwiniaceae bacterium PD-1]
MAEKTLISGIYRDPFDVPLPDVKIIIFSQINTQDTFRQVSVRQVTASDGSYAFSLLPGAYTVEVVYPQGKHEKLGSFILDTGSPSGSLNDYLLYGENVLADPIVYNDIRKIHGSVKKFASEVSLEVETTGNAALQAAKDAVLSSQAATLAEKHAVEASSAAVEAHVSSTLAQSSLTDTKMARDEAVNARDAANIAVVSAGIMPDIATGLTKTQNGQSFSVAQGVGADSAVVTYINDKGTGRETSRIAGTALVEATKAIAVGIEQRTQGLQTQIKSTNPIEFVDKKGFLAFAIADDGKAKTPGGLQTSSVDAEQLNANMAVLSALKTDRVNIGVSQIIKPFGNWLTTEEDKSGNVIFGTRLDGTKIYLGQPLHNRAGLLNNDFFFIGDSITAFTETTSGAYNDINRNEKPCVCDQGWPQWSEALSDGVIKVAGISATGGYRADQILVTHVPRAIAASPAFCVVLAGRNNIVQNINYDKTTSDLTAIYRRLRQAGIVPVCCSMSAQSGNSPEQDSLRYQVNEFIRAYADHYHLPFVDMHEATTDPLSGEWYSSLNYDASHPTGVGAKLMGQRLVDAMRVWVKPVTARMAVNHTDPLSSNNYVTDPLFLNNAPDWITDIAGTSTFTSDPAVKGNIWRLVGGKSHITLDVKSGGRYGFGFRWKTDNGQSNNFYAIAGNDPAGTEYLAGIKRWKTASDGFGYFYREFVVSDSNTQVTLIFDASDMSVAQLGVLKITEIN